VTTPDAVVFIVDDDDSVRQALTALFRSAGLSAQPFPSAREFLQHRRPDSPACLILDVRLPGLSGLDLQRELRAAGDRIPVVFITAHGDIPMSVRAMKGGAVEFLLKPFLGEDLIGVALQALERDRAARAGRAELESVKQRYSSLTAREREVMARVVDGKLNKQIAADLGVAQITIKVHRRNLMGKMRAASLADLVHMADRLAYGKAP
jgi:FixJ family two-component response regulator